MRKIIFLLNALLVLALFLEIKLLLGGTSSVIAQTPQIRLATMSDSTTDEYRANDNRAGSTQYALTTLGWTELLDTYREFDLGPWGTRSEPRRSGFEYNWARSGAVASTLVSDGQHTGVASLVSAGKIDMVYFQIGNNDFAYYADGASIYNGTIAGTALTTKLNSITSNIQFALDTVLNSNANIKVLLGTIPDPGQTPYWQSQYPDSAKRMKVTNAINTTNDSIKSLAAARPRVTIFDQQIFAQNLLSRVDATGSLKIGNEKITLLTTGDEPHHLTLSDNIHGGTVIEGLFANEIITHINTMLGRSVPLFSDAEILNNAGIAGGPTLTPSPTPSSNTFTILKQTLTAYGTQNTSLERNGDTKLNVIDSVFIIKS